MTFVDLITNGSAGERRGILIAATLAGIANAVLLVLVNVVAESPHRAGLRSFGMFALAIILYILGARRTYYRTGAVIEGALHR